MPSLLFLCSFLPNVKMAKLEKRFCKYFIDNRFFSPTGSYDMGHFLYKQCLVSKIK